MQLKQYFVNVCSDWQHQQHSYTPAADGKGREDGEGMEEEEKGKYG